MKKAQSFTKDAGSTQNYCHIYTNTLSI